MCLILDVITGFLFRYTNPSIILTWFLDPQDGNIYNAALRKSQNMNGEKLFFEIGGFLMMPWGACLPYPPFKPRQWGELRQALFLLDYGRATLKRARPVLHLSCKRMT